MVFRKYYSNVHNALIYVCFYSPHAFLSLQHLRRCTRMCRIEDREKVVEWLKKSVASLAGYGVNGISLVVLYSAVDRTISISDY